MPRLTDELERHDVIGIDTQIFIYHFEGADELASTARQVFRAVRAGALRSITSVITLTEILVQPVRRGELEIARQYELALTRMPGLRLIEIDRAQASLAADLRASHRIQIGDALQIAAALASGATAFVTNDLRLGRVTELDILMLNDYLAQD